MREKKSEFIAFRTTEEIKTFLDELSEEDRKSTRLNSSH
jgi:hypothetical protein